MRTRLLLPLLIGIIARADDFSEELNRLSGPGSHSREAAALFVEAELEVQRSNPDYYAAAATFWWHMALAKEATDKLDAGGIPDGKGDPLIRQRAIDLAIEGHRRFPQRVDIALFLALLEIRTDRPDNAVATVRTLLDQAKSTPDNLTWKDNARLPSAPDTFIPDQLTLHTFLLITTRAPRAPDLARELASATIAVYPDHPRAYSALAEIANLQGDREAAFHWLKLGHTKAPSDRYLLDCLIESAHRIRRFGDLPQLYRDLLATDIDEETRKNANKSLDQVNSRLAKGK
ncbi:hypothetical protein [Luteolibacter sp. LG18]|uniref:tetratricopeptide repeat protein n=1 Tax=Luteolibacter sp. LG18 TaxID=2819286 RepID=UPI0030C73AA1